MRDDNFNLTLYKNKQTTEQINQQNIQDEVTNFDFNINNINILT